MDSKEGSMKGLTEKEKAELQSVIPYGKTVRVNNFMLWRTTMKVGKRERAYKVDCLNVTDLEGLWMTRIPATYEMYAMILHLLSQREQGDKDSGLVLETFFCNMMSVGCLDNGHFQKAVQMCVTAYIHPDLVKDEKFLSDFKSVGEQFLEWRKRYDEKLKESEPTEEEEKQEEIAEQAMDVLSES